MNKLVRERITLNEKFTDDESDPIHDMGIGGYSFDTLKFGSVIRPIKDTGLSNGNKGTFTYMNKGINLWKGKPIVVISNRKYVVTGFRVIEVFVPSGSTGLSDLELAELRQRMKADPSYSGWGMKSRMILTEKQFNSKFEVTEKGF